MFWKYQTFDYTFIPEDLQREEITKVLNCALPDYRVFVIRQTNPSEAWGDKHLFDFSEIGYNTKKKNLNFLSLPLMTVIVKKEYIKR